MRAEPTVGPFVLDGPLRHVQVAIAAADAGGVRPVTQQLHEVDRGGA